LDVRRGARFMACGAQDDAGRAACLVGFGDCTCLILGMIFRQSLRQPSLSLRPFWPSKALPTDVRPFVGYSLIWQQHQDDLYNIEYNNIIWLRVIYDGATLESLAWQTEVATTTHARSTTSEVCHHRQLDQSQQFSQIHQFLFCPNRPGICAVILAACAICHAKT
jgi:hypothetical protein